MLAGWIDAINEGVKSRIRYNESSNLSQDCCKTVFDQPQGINRVGLPL